MRVSLGTVVAGTVGQGAGGSATSYSFDAITGLSNDSRLAPYLQSLTSSQLQTALDGQSPSADLISLLYQDVTGTGAGSLPDGGSLNPAGAMPGWVWALGIGVVGLIAITAVKN